MLALSFLLRTGWRHCDDSRVTTVENERVVVNKDAYLLFYQRRGQSALLNCQQNGGTSYHAASSTSTSIGMATQRHGISDSANPEISHYSQACFKKDSGNNNTNINLSGMPQAQPSFAFPSSSSNLKHVHANPIEALSERKNITKTNNSNLSDSDDLNSAAALSTSASLNNQKLPRENHTHVHSTMTGLSSTDNWNNLNNVNNIGEKKNGGSESEKCEFELQEMTEKRDCEKEFVANCDDDKASSQMDTDDDDDDAEPCQPHLNIDAVVVDLGYTDMEAVD